MRAIDADHVIKKLDELQPFAGNKAANAAINLAKDVVRNAPTLSPDDVRGVGKWEQKEIINLEGTTIEQVQSAYCSVCEKYHTTPFSYYFTEYNYCPSCGARLGNGGTDDS